MQKDPQKDSNKRLRSSYVSAIISISLVLFMLGLLGLLVIDARKISDYVKEHVELNIFLQDQIADSEIESFRENLQSLPFVKNTRFVSKEEALDSLKKELGEGAVSMLESNPLPATIDINLKADYAHPDSLRLISQLLAQNKMVRDVVYQETEISRINKNFRTMGLVILFFCALLFFVAIALIHNTIRLSMYSKRFLIKSMQLVGATKNFIRWPFIRKGLSHGLYAGIVASALLGGIIYLIETRFPVLGQLSDLRIMGILFGCVLVLGILLSGVSTFFAVNRYLRLRMEELY
ncbi:MAG: ABC transporter permease [Bacteroidetes bacterium]|nr:ABC transporter permease [Bacteroidota bacterium]MBK9541480.1 ABC transporter permease [Bacteroidota bacterium]MBL0258648.1 ABC transporter permease [Bacteroidota bacterium]MBP6401189.1 ABC transporter permease [Bacteroidia bacterium]MBP6648548.1 ABC transporter permease [Bacteroidia bacterium]